MNYTTKFVNAYQGLELACSMIESTIAGINWEEYPAQHDTLSYAVDMIRHINEAINPPIVDDVEEPVKQGQEGVK